MTERSPSSHCSSVRMFIHGNVTMNGELIEEVGFWVTSPSVLPVGSSVEIPLNRVKWSGGWGIFVKILSYELDQHGQLWVNCSNKESRRGHEIELASNFYPTVPSDEIESLLLSEGASHYSSLLGQSGN